MEEDEANKSLKEKEEEHIPFRNPFLVKDEAWEKENWDIEEQAESNPTKSIIIDSFIRARIKLDASETWDFSLRSPQDLLSKNKEVLILENRQFQSLLNSNNVFIKCLHLNKNVVEQPCPCCNGRDTLEISTCLDCLSHFTSVKQKCTSSSSNQT